MPGARLAETVSVGLVWGIKLQLNWARIGLGTEDGVMAPFGGWFATGPRPSIRCRCLRRMVTAKPLNPFVGVHLTAIQAHSCRVQWQFIKAIFIRVTSGSEPVIRFAHQKDQVGTSPCFLSRIERQKCWAKSRWQERCIAVVVQNEFLSSLVTFEDGGYFECSFHADALQNDLMPISIRYRLYRGRRVLQQYPLSCSLV